jgi:hypothetical protein
MIRCFYLEPTSLIRRELRRYGGTCSGPYSYHNASVFLDEIERAEGEVTKAEMQWPRDDPRWPAQCPCGYVFQATDSWQLFVESLYRRSDNGELTSIRDAPPGAIWNSSWLAKYPHWAGADGLSLHFKGPDGNDFSIDARASNCTLPDDDAHKCWVRHGIPPDITVDKRAGIPGASAATTCGAGAGSFVSKNWHGFLRNGHLENC